MDQSVQLVQVDWEDSAQPVASWMHLTDLPDLAVIQCSSVGWIVAQDDKVLMLAPNLGDRLNEANAQASGIIRIPKRCIVAMKPLHALPADWVISSHVKAEDFDKNVLKAIAHSLENDHDLGKAEALSDASFILTSIKLALSC